MLVSVAFACGLCVGADAPRMDDSKFHVGAYLFPSLAELHTEEHVRDIRDCGIDFMLWNVSAADRQLLDWFHKYGLGCVVDMEGAPGWGGGTGANAGKMRERNGRARYERALDGLADHPAIWMLSLCDEPSALDFEYIGELCRLYRERRPATPAHVNLYPNYASSFLKGGKPGEISQLGTTSYAEHIAEYVKKVPLDYISYDFYVYFGAKKRELVPKMFDNFRIVADACRSSGKRFWYVAEVNSRFPDMWLTANMLRYQVFCALAFGAESVSWWAWDMKAGGRYNNVISLDGKKTEQYGRLKEVNAELHRLGGVCLRFRNVATHFVGFAGSDDLKAVPVKAVQALDAGHVTGLRGNDASSLVVGEMTPRKSADKDERALFVAAADDPYDEFRRPQTIAFRADGCDVNVLGRQGPLTVPRTVDGTFSLRLNSCEAVLIVTKKH